MGVVAAIINSMDVVVSWLAAEEAAAVATVADRHEHCGGREAEDQQRQECW